eukprot:4991335-Karenia_brevis.AAC.1
MMTHLVRIVNLGQSREMMHDQLPACPCCLIAGASNGSYSRSASRMMDTQWTHNGHTVDTTVDTTMDT